MVQSCNLNNQKTTVLYGHLDLDSIKLQTDSDIKTGDFLGNLAPGGSVNSGGERKHLHLGVIKGESVDFRGYVQGRQELIGWLDYQELEI